MVSARKKKHQYKEKQISQMNRTLNDFVIGNDTNVDAIKN